MTARSPSDSDDPNLGSLRDDGLPVQLHGGLSMSASNPVPSLSRNVTYRLPDYDFGCDLDSIHERRAQPFFAYDHIQA